MSETALGPWGESDARKRGTFWSWKASSPITRVEMVGFKRDYRGARSHRVLGVISSLTFKSTNNDPMKFGQERPLPRSDPTDTSVMQPPINFGFDIKAPSEYLTGISGWYALEHGKNTYVHSLTFETNLGHVYGPWPQDFLITQPMFPEFKGTPFSYKVPAGSLITGFHGFLDSYKYTKAFGIYVKPIPPTTPTPAPPPRPSRPSIFIDQWGGSGGASWEFLPKGAISQVVVCHDKQVGIHSLKFKSQDGDESKVFGGKGGNPTTVEIKPGVSITGIEGTIGKRGSYDVVTSLKFSLSNGDVTDRFGEFSGTEFALSRKGTIAGFHGRSNVLVHAIGVYLQEE